MSIENIRKELIKKTKEKVREKYKQKDVHVVKAIGLIDELDKKVNELTELFIEWYGVHFPELQYIVSDQEKYLETALLGDKEKFTKPQLEKILGKELAEKAMEKITESMGPGIEKETMKKINGLAETILAMKNSRKDLAFYVEKEMKLIAPNFSELCGPILGARFLAHAGSLERLAMLPSSTLQVYGAEKALFRHLKGQGKSPKHGYLFAHQLLRSLKPWQRGKAARSLSGKLAIALKADYFGKDNIADQLKKELDERIKRIKETK